MAFLGGERGIRLLFQGNAVRVGPTQFPRLWHLHIEVVHHLRLARRARAVRLPDAGLQRRRLRRRRPVHRRSTRPRSNCSTTTSSGSCSSHEMGHVMSGHALYHTIAAILSLVSLGALPLLAGIALLPIKLAFLEWSRKSELSADRAGLLGRPGRRGGAAAVHEDGRRRPRQCLRAAR